MLILVFSSAKPRSTSAKQKENPKKVTKPRKSVMIRVRAPMPEDEDEDERDPLDFLS